MNEENNTYLRNKYLPIKILEMDDIKERLAKTQFIKR